MHQAVAITIASRSVRNFAEATLPISEEDKLDDGQITHLIGVHLKIWLSDFAGGQGFWFSFSSLSSFPVVQQLHRMRLFCLQLEASCLQWSFFNYS